MTIAKINGATIAALATVNGVAKSSQIIDDTWADDLFSSRTATFGFIVNGLVQSTCSVWTVSGGSPSVSGGTVSFPTNSGIKTPVAEDTGIWETYYARDNVLTKFQFSVAVGATRKYSWTKDASNTHLHLYDHADTADVITGTSANDTNLHTAKFTRDGSSNWEIFDNGGSQGTVTDATTTNFDSLHFWSSANASTAQWVKKS